MKIHQMNRKTFLLSIIFLLGIFMISSNGLAQATKDPLSFEHKLMSVNEIDQRTMHFNPLSVPARETERVGPKRVAMPMPLGLSITDAGTWETLPDGGTIWRLRVNSLNAHFLSFKFSRFHLPPGAELYFVSVYRDFQVGPFTELNNQSGGRFGSPVIAGDASVIELYLPAGDCNVELTLESVSHGFKNALGMSGFGYRNTLEAEARQDSMPRQPDGVKAANFNCQRDINCPEGQPWQNEKRAVAEGYDGAYICSGQLINNVRGDNRYLYITAGHCGWDADPPTMSFYWNYENTGCGTNDSPPWTYSTGSTNLFHVDSGNRDMNLLELDGPNLEGLYNIYFMGWNRDGVAPTSSSMISHPDDKPKQIVIRNSPAIDCDSGPCGGGWGSNYFRITGWDVGVDEGGSSGGGLMDQDHLLVATLTGGVGTDCDNFAWDEFAKISYEWNNLKAHLDPDNTGAMFVNGRDHSDPPGGGGGNPPGKASSPSPGNGATGVATNTQLSWSAGSGAASHDVYFGTTSNPASQGNQGGTSFNPGSLSNDTTYYWRIDEVNAEGTTTGDLWSFTTAAAGGGSDDVVTITEAKYDSGKDEFKVKATSSEQPNAILTVVGWGNMTFNKNKYELKIKPLAPLTAPQSVTVVSSLGGSAMAPVVGAPPPGGGSAPGQASGPSPADSATGVSINTSLSWTAGSDTTSHNVYFGTTSSPPSQGSQGGTTFNPGTLANDTTYYWRIDEVNSEGTTTGPTWSFTTESAGGGGGDTVTITKAEWKASKEELKIEATSSDQPNVTLTVVGYGVMTYKANKNKYELKKKPEAYVSSVTVTSSGGGTDTKSVTIK
ncbi:MAG: Ig-like domain-containing protein [bacterium]|nr:Ig-like domain-containing protein [bacterium]